MPITFETNKQLTGGGRATNAESFLQTWVQIGIAWHMWPEKMIHDRDIPIGIIGIMLSQRQQEHLEIVLMGPGLNIPPQMG